MRRFEQPFQRAPGGHPAMQITGRDRAVWSNVESKRRFKARRVVKRRNEQFRLGMHRFAPRDACMALRDASLTSARLLIPRRPRASPTVHRGSWSGMAKVLCGSCPDAHPWAAPASSTVLWCTHAFGYGETWAELVVDVAGVLGFGGWVEEAVCLPAVRV